MNIHEKGKPVKARLRAAAAAALLISLADISGGALFTAKGAEPIYIEPLFEYPVAPEELPDLQSKTDYLMEHFWDAMDFSKDTPVDQNALNDAFGVYAQSMPYASKDAVMKSITTLLKRYHGNSTLTLQFAKAAEEALYGNRAYFWSDEVYLPFLKEIVGNKKIPELRKARYAAQLELVKRNSIGAKFPRLRITCRDGRQKDYRPECEYTIVEFGNPGCEDCRFSKTKLSMASDLQELVEEGKLEILFLVADAVPEEQEEILRQFAGYPASWQTAISYGADDIFDIRRTPSFFVLGKDGKIIAKNLDVTDAVECVRGLIKPKTYGTEK